MLVAAPEQLPKNAKAIAALDELRKFCAERQQFYTHDAVRMHDVPDLILAILGEPRGAGNSAIYRTLRDRVRAFVVDRCPGHSGDRVPIDTVPSLLQRFCRLVLSTEDVMRACGGSASSSSSSSHGKTLQHLSTETVMAIIQHDADAAAKYAGLGRESLIDSIVDRDASRVDADGARDLQGFFLSM